jgi:hypothetical protein
MRQALTVIATAALALASLSASAGGINAEGQEMRPSGKGFGIPETRPDMLEMAKKALKTATAQIKYHSGPVMTSTGGLNVYLIWYGNWSGNTGTSIVPDFVNNLGGSPYWNINTTYYDASSAHIKNIVTLKGQTTDSYSQGTTLTDAAVFSVVKSAIASGALPTDPNAVYMVLTSKDVNESSGFCTQYCGWHTNGSYNSATIKYSFVGDASRCITSCAAQSAGPNGNAGVDGMISVMAHELEEAATDPTGAGWYFSTGAENGDKCAWTFGTEYTAANGALANMKLGTRDYLIQQNWIRATSGKCALSY